MKTLPVLLAAILLLAGCSATGYRWHNPRQTDPQALNSATQSCRLLAEDELQTYGYPGPYPYFGRPWAYRHLHHRYLGYPDYFHWYRNPYFAEDQLFRVCMKAKGWQLVPEKPESGRQG